MVIRRNGRSKGEGEGCGSQLLGAGLSALFPFIFCSMHLVTMSARLSSETSAWPFSVDIQHSVAARSWVMGSSGAAAGLAAWVVGALVVWVAGASVPVVWQPDRAAPANSSSTAPNAVEETGLWSARIDLISKVMSAAPGGFKFGHRFAAEHEVQAAAFPDHDVDALYRDFYHHGNVF
jgi:hypothetical protein